MQTLNDIQNVMKQDRLNGDVRTESQNEFYNKLQEMHPNNTVVLEHSPYIKIKKTGVIWPWSEAFAERPDLCECCNADGSPWTGAPAAAPAKPVAVNGVITRTNINNEHAAPVGLASEKLGVDKSFSQDFSRANGSHEAMPLPEQSESVDVGSIIDAVFKTNVK